MCPQVPRRLIVSQSRVNFRLCDRRAAVTNRRSQRQPPARSTARLSKHRQHQARRAHRLRQVTRSSTWHRPMLARVAQPRLRFSARRATRPRPQLLILRQPPAMRRSPKFSDKQRRRAPRPQPTARSIAPRQPLHRQRRIQHPSQRQSRLRFSAASLRRADQLQAVPILRQLQPIAMQHLLQAARRRTPEAQPALQLSLAQPAMHHLQHQPSSGPQMRQVSQALPSAPIQHQTRRIQVQQTQRR